MNFIMEIEETNKEPKICAMRGRSDGEWHESEHEQRIECREDGVTNTITGVSKDNMVAEPIIIANTAGFGQCYVSKEVSPTIKSSAFQYNNTLIEPKQQDQVVLGWVRDEKGNMIKRPSVDVANTVTASKRDNTQNYVKEQIPLNTDQDWLATTVTTAHHYSGNIVDQKRGQKEMGVLETFNKNKEYEQRRIFEECNEANTREVLRILRQEVGEKAFLEKMGRLGCFQETEILQPRLYEESICNQGYEQPERRPGASLGEENSLYDREQGTEMRDLRQDGSETGCTPQGRELQQQFIREFDACLSELPHETAQTEKCLHYLRKHLQSMPWLLRQTLQTMEEIREPDDSKPQIGFRVRRLTCRELFRLMDVSEEDIDKIQSAGISKTQQAKMAGNSIVVNCMFHIFRKLFIDNNQENQQLQLF